MVFDSARKALNQTQQVNTIHNPVENVRAGVLRLWFIAFLPVEVIVLLHLMPWAWTCERSRCEQNCPFLVNSV